MKPTEVASSDIPKAEFHGVMVMQENQALVHLIRAARGERVEVDQLRHTIVGGMDLAIKRIGPDKQASFAFKKARESCNYCLADDVSQASLFWLGRPHMLFCVTSGIGSAIDSSGLH
jgi:hypothetical protein